MKHSSGVLPAALALVFLLASGCGTSAPQKISSGPAGFSGQDIDEMKPAPKEHNAPGTALTPALYETEVARSKGLVLIDFWANWCVSCKKMAPLLSELSVELSGKIKFSNVDLSDEAPEKKNPLATQFNIDSLPCLILFKDGKELDRKVGALTKDELKAWLKNSL